jgi:NTE family protein
MSALTPEDQSDLVRRLAKTPLFDIASRFDLGRLLTQAKKVKKSCDDADPYVCREGQKADAFYVMMQGEYAIDGRAHVDVGPFGGGILGLAAAIGGGDHTATVRAVTDCTYLEIHAASAKALYHESPAFRRAVAPLMRPAPGTPTTQTSAANEPRCAGAIVHFDSRIPKAPLAFLVELLGREITTEFPDRVLLVRPKAPDAPQEQPTMRPREGHGYLFTVAADEAWIHENRGDYDYVLCQWQECKSLRHIVVKLVLAHLSEPTDPPAPGDVRTLETVVVQPAPLPCASELVVAPANRGGLKTYGECRIHLSFETLRQLEPNFGAESPMSTLDPRLRLSLGVWARALTLRRTGLTIGGGGVFAMTGVWVIKRLLEEGVPIDVLTGTSGGALVGSFYASLGPYGLERVVAQGDCGALDAMVTASMVCGSAMQHYLACELGDACIEHLPHEFYPGTSSVSGGAGVVAVRGPLGLAVRAASSTPPLFAGTITSGLRLSDGAFTNNVPAQALELFGADVTFALNVYPPSRLPLLPFVPHCVQQGLSSFSILNRLLTFTSAFNLLASASGRVEADFATVAFNASSADGLPYLTISNFFQSSKMVKAASQNEQLEAKIQAFVAAYDRVKTRSHAPVHAPPR